MRILFALALLFTPVPALAGQRATYTESDGKQLVILVADNGDARIDGPEPGRYGLYRGGEFYLVARNEGAWTVARVADIAEAFAKVMPTVFRDIAGAAAKPARPSPRIVAQGRRSHLGREGQVYEVFFAGSDKPEDSSTLLMSSDAALKPIGAALEQFTLSLTLLMGAFIGPAVEEALAETRALFSLGTPLDMEGSYTLLNLEEVDIAHEALEFPAKPQTLEQIVAETKLRALTPEEMTDSAGVEGVDAGPESTYPTAPDDAVTLEDEAPAAPDAGPQRSSLAGAASQSQ